MRLFDDLPPTEREISEGVADWHRAALMRVPKTPLQHAQQAHSYRALRGHLSACFAEAEAIQLALQLPHWWEFRGQRFESFDGAWKALQDSGDLWATKVQLHYRLPDGTEEHFSTSSSGVA